MVQTDCKVESSKKLSFYVNYSCRTKALRNPSNALIVNLAISDFMMMATNCPPYFFSSLQGQWIFGKEGTIAISLG